MGGCREEEQRAHMLQHLEEVVLVAVSHFPMVEGDLQDANQAGDSSL